MKTILFEIHSMDELEKLIVKSVENAVHDLKSNEKNPDELLTTNQLCSMLQITRPTAWNLLKNGVISGLRIGSQLRYRRGDVLENLTKINNK